MGVKVIFHCFTMGDVDDVDIYVAEPIYQWQQTEQGKWVMEHAQDLTYHTAADPNTFGYRVSIHGEIAEGPRLTEYLLKYQKHDKSS
jgi:hypothetical protein